MEGSAEFFTGGDYFSHGGGDSEFEQKQMDSVNNNNNFAVDDLLNFTKEEDDVLTDAFLNSFTCGNNSGDSSSHTVVDSCNSSASGGGGGSGGDAQFNGSLSCRSFTDTQFSGSELCVPVCLLSSTPNISLLKLCCQILVDMLLLDFIPFLSTIIFLVILSNLFLGNYSKYPLFCMENNRA